MGILSKKHLLPVIKTIWYVSRNSSSPSLYNIPKRHLHQQQQQQQQEEEQQQQRHLHSLRNHDNNGKLLLRRRHGNRVNRGFHYFSQLSTEKGENFSPKQNLYLPFDKIPQCDYSVEGCNGLLCLDDYDMNTVVIWNPSTKEFKVLPQSYVQRPPDANITFGGSCGFGFDPKSEDYKFIRFFCSDFVDQEGCYIRTYPQVELYSLRNDSWKEISHPPKVIAYGRSYACLNGTYYWKALIEYENVILSFSFPNEEFSFLPLPDLGKRIIGGPFTFELLDYNGSLGLIVYPKRGTEMSIDLWVMNGGSWTKECVINVLGVKRPVGFWKNGEMFLESSSHQLLLFDPATRELKNLGIRDHSETMQLIPLVESLVPLNGKLELEEEHVIHQPGI